MNTEDLRVLIVDDSIVYRKILKAVIEEVPGAVVCGTASNGRLAIARLEHSPADFVILDLEMPEMDGLQALEEIHRRWPDIGVLLFSGTTRSQADLIVEALSKGAIDCLQKPEGGDASQNRTHMVRQLGAVIRAFSTRLSLQRARGLGMAAKLPNPSDPRGPRPGADPTEAEIAGSTSLQPSSAAARRAAPMMLGELPSVSLRVGPAPPPGRIDVVVIGSSTGGPQALASLIPALPADLGVPVLVVQHMPPLFTASLAKSLNQRSPLRVEEAHEGQLVAPGLVLLAPGGKHMVVRVEAGDGCIRKVVSLNDGPPENSVRPSVDVLFRSVAALYDNRVLAIVLTGMGEDGARGVRALKQRGAYCITQNEESCVIYGMPRAVEQSGLSDESLPLQTIAGRISSLMKGTRGQMGLGQAV